MPYLSDMGCSLEQNLTAMLAVIGIAEVIQAHKPPAVIVQPVLKDEMLKDANKDDTEGDNIT